MTDQSNVVPFGKYKGRIIEELLTDDPAYLQWLASQDWFRTRFVALHQVIINRGAEPEETPEHNALQVLFLDDDFSRRFFQRLFPDSEAEAHAYFERRRRELTDELSNQYAYERKWKEEWLAKLSASSAMEIQILKSFEVGGADVELQVKFRHGIELDGPRIRIEIKPAVGDDYPAVLRQMRRAETKVLFLEQYTGKGATQEQFIQTFKTANMVVVFRDEIADKK
jgi:uncharacterized protein (DUF3820 family)